MTNEIKEKYELWQLEDGYEFFPESNTSAKDSLSPKAKLIWTVEAISWDEAQTKKHEYLGWEPYIAMKD